MRFRIMQEPERWFSGDWGYLGFIMRQFGIKARPVRRRLRPYDRLRANKVRIVKRPGAYESQMWARFGYAE